MQVGTGVRVLRGCACVQVFCLFSPSRHEKDLPLNHAQALGFKKEGPLLLITKSVCYTSSSSRKTTRHHGEKLDGHVQTSYDITLPL